MKNQKNNLREDIQLRVFEEYPDLKQKESHYFRIEDGHRGQFLYKYLDLESAILSLDSNNLRFVEPTLWIDKYEGRFYKADYSNVSKNSRDFPFLYACCFTLQKDNEAAWKLYTYGKIGLGAKCVQFVIKRKKIREELEKLNAMAIYEGTVYYLDEKRINDIHKKYLNKSIRINPDYSSFFTRFNLNSYLNLLLLKRQYFFHEREVRFFLIPNVGKKRAKKHTKNGNICYGEAYLASINWNNVIERIRIDSSCSDIEYKLLEDICLKRGLPIPEKVNVYGTKQTIKID